MVGYQTTTSRFRRIMKVEYYSFYFDQVAWFFLYLKIIISQKVIVARGLFFPNHLVLKVEKLQHTFVFVIQPPEFTVKSQLYVSQHRACFNMLRVPRNQLILASVHSKQTNAGVGISCVRPPLVHSSLSFSL